MENPPARLVANASTTTNTPTYPVGGSAHSVVFIPSSCPDLLYNGKETYYDMDSFSYFRDERSFCQEGISSNFIRDNDDTCLISHDSEKTIESKLPFKKRKALYNLLKSDMGENEINEASVQTNISSEIPMNYYTPHQSCKCEQLSRISIFGKSPMSRIQEWTSEQVLLWLWNILYSARINPDSICSILRNLDGRNGEEMSTITKQKLQHTLERYGVAIGLVWEPLCEKVESGQLVRSTEAFYKFSKTGASEAKKNEQRIYQRGKRRRRSQCVGQLWEFIFGLLENPNSKSIICWEDKAKKLFRIVDTEELAKQWGEHKGNRKMTYANMSRTMRYYQGGKGAFIRNDRKRVYGFGPKADFDKLRAKLTKSLV